MKMFRIKVPRSTYPEFFTQEGYNELCAAVRAWQVAIETPEEIEVIVRETDGNHKPGHRTRGTVGVQTAQTVGKL